MSITRAPELNGGTLTNWLPLTTTWPSDSRCSTAIYSQLGSNGKAIAYDPFYGLKIDASLTCHPAAAIAWWNQGETPSSGTVQSLGPFECGGDYTTAVTSMINDKSTFVACCPSNYNFGSSTQFGNLGQCVSMMTSGQILSYMSIASIDNKSFRSAVTTLRVNTLAYAVHVNGYIFADSVTTKAVTESGTLSISRQTSGTDSISAPTASPSSSSPPISTTLPIGLSSSAKIGIGVGVSIGLLGILALGLALFLVRRQRKRADYSTSPHISDSGAGLVGEGQQGYSGTHGRQKIGQVSEVGLGHQERVFEMSGEGRVK